MDKGQSTIRNRLAWPLGLGFLWLIFLLVLAIWSVQAEREHVMRMAEREAKAFFQQIVVTRSWNAAHGGVYVLATDSNPPNKYLPVEDRLVETVDGRMLTKINPAYMTRQISSIANEDHQVQFHITSLDPIRPENKADKWESGALVEFSSGGREKFELVDTSAGQQFRYMAPLDSEERCMKCHAKYGHEGRDILGGISVSFSAAPLIETRKSSVAQTHLAFTMIFLVGFVGICGSTYLVQKKRDEAERANRPKYIFLANMSHDMRTPLNGIMGMTELMQQKGLSREQSRYADMVRHSAWTLLEIVKDITDFSRLESGRMDLSAVTFDVREMLNETLSVFRYETSSKGLELSSIVAPNLPNKLKGDVFRLKQILTNLVGNAVKFTDHGKVSVRVFRGASPEGANPDLVRMRVEVEDTGIGIPIEEQKGIFDSFRQVDDSYAKKHEGSGLGLTICRQLVEMMGGSIAVESDPGKGAVFSFDVLLEEAPDNAEGEESEALSEKIPATRPRQILVAEDNILNQTFAQEILEEAGHPVVIVENGIEALEALRNADFDMVFMDVQMPDMDGLEATRRIRAGEAGEHARNIPIVAATAFAVRGDCEKCREAGMNGYVVKPMQSSDLLRAVAMYTGEDEELDCEVIVDDVKGSEMTIDIDAALKRLGGRRELFDKLADKFMEDVPVKLDTLGQRIAEGDMDDVLRLAHGIKNSAGMIQANSMADVALAMEMAVRENRLTEIPELFDSLRLVADETLAAVKRCLEV